MTKIYSIDKFKYVTELPLTPEEAPVVFPIHIGDMNDLSGGMRTKLDFVLRVAESLNVKPLFIDNEQDSHIDDFLRASTNSIVVGTNRLPSDDCPDKERFVSIGLQDLTGCGVAERYDVTLSPRFRPISFRPDYPEPNPNQIRIDYTCLPSRIRPSAGFFSPNAALPADLRGKSETIAVYVRHHSGNVWTLQRFLNQADKLRLHHNFRFTFTDGPATSKLATAALREYAAQRPDTEFYSASYWRDHRDVMETMFDKAPTIVVSDDTISGTSDAVAAEKRVFCYTSPSGAGMLNYGKPSSNVNYTFMSELIRQNRLQVFSPKALLSSWQPSYRDEWAEHGAVIAGVIRGRQARIQQRHFNVA